VDKKLPSKVLIKDQLIHLLHIKTIRVIGQWWGSHGIFESTGQSQSHAGRLRTHAIISMQVSYAIQVVHKLKATIDKLGLFPTGLVINYDSDLHAGAQLVAASTEAFYQVVDTLLID